MRPFQSRQSASLLGSIPSGLKGGGLEHVNLSVTGGGRLGGVDGGTIGSVNLDAGGSGMVRVCMPVSSGDVGASCVLDVSPQSGPGHQVLLAFSPLVRGPGKFINYGVARGAPADGFKNCSIFVEVDQTTVDGPMNQVAVRVTGSALVSGPGGQPISQRLLTIGDNGCIEISVVDSVPEALDARVSLSESSDGELLSVVLNFL